ncbi:hypothetical protein ACET42_31040, partial [Pseudomonas aeruginosa]
MTKLIWGGLLCAACLSGCSSPPELSQPTGSWVDLNPPAVKAKAQTSKPATTPPAARVSTLEGSG